MREKELDTRIDNIERCLLFLSEKIENGGISDIREDIEAILSYRDTTKEV